MVCEDQKCVQLLFVCMCCLFYCEYCGYYNTYCSVVSGEAPAGVLLACRNVLCSTSHLSVSSHLFYTSVQLKTRVFWDMAVCRWVCVSRRFEPT